MRRRALTFLGLALCATAGCGGADHGSVSTGSSPAAATAKVVTTPAAAKGPQVTIPPGPEPQRLIVKDLRKGTGPPAKVGQRLTVRYVGAYWNGTLAANAYDYRYAPNFPLGSSEIMGPGLNRGIEGMRAGGRREIILPYKLRYFPDDGIERNYPPPGERTMVYVVSLLKIE